MKLWLKSHSRLAGWALAHPCWAGLSGLLGVAAFGFTVFIYWKENSVNQVKKEPKTHLKLRDKEGESEKIETIKEQSSAVNYEQKLASLNKKIEVLSIDLKLTRNELVSKSTDYENEPYGSERKNELCNEQDELEKNIRIKENDKFYLILEKSEFLSENKKFEKAMQCSENLVTYAQNWRRYDARWAYFQAQNNRVFVLINWALSEYNKRNKNSAKAKILPAQEIAEENFIEYGLYYGLFQWDKYSDKVKGPRDTRRIGGDVYSWKDEDRPSSYTRIIGDIVNKINSGEEWKNIVEYDYFESSEDIHSLFFCLSAVYCLKSVTNKNDITYAERGMSMLRISKRLIDKKKNPLLYQIFCSNAHNLFSMMGHSFVLSGNINFSRKCIQDASAYGDSDFLLLVRGHILLLSNRTKEAINLYSRGLRYGEDKNEFQNDLVKDLRKISDQKKYLPLVHQVYQALGLDKK